MKFKFIEVKYISQILNLLNVDLINYKNKNNFFYCIIILKHFHIL